MRIHHWSQYQKCSARDSQCLLGLRRLQAKFRCQQFLQLVEQKCPDSPVFGRLLGGQNRVPGRPHHKAFRAGRTSGCAWDRDDIGMTLENGDAAMLNFSPSQMPLLSYLMAHKKGGTSNISHAILASVILCHWATCFSRIHPRNLNKKIHSGDP